MSIVQSFKNLTRFERGLWAVSSVVVAASYVVGGDSDVLTLLTSLVGVTALIFVARGDVLGQVLTVLFSVGYAVVSYRLRYFGEMATYLGMTMPIAVASVVAWLRHPYEEGESEVRVRRLGWKGFVPLLLLAVAVTVVFYYVLRYFGTANLAVSTLSVLTSFLASSLMLLRSPTYALAYASNDLVLIVLWGWAALRDVSYLPMVLCFVTFLANDVYAFVNWLRMLRRQEERRS